MIALTRWGIAPTRLRDAVSMCSPVVALRPCQSSFWSRWYYVRECFVVENQVAAHRPRSDHHDSDIGPLSGRDGLSKAGLIIRPPLTALGISHCSFASSFDAIKRGNTSILAQMRNVVTILYNYQSNQFETSKGTLTFIKPWAIGPMTATLVVFFNGRRLL